MSNHNTATLRKLGESAKDVGGKVGNAILDFDLNIIGWVIGYIGLAYGFIVICFACYKGITKDINNWKTYHIGQKIIYPIVSLLWIFLLCGIVWVLLSAI